jgi:serine O-acetyltransferase
MGPTDGGADENAFLQYPAAKLEAVAPDGRTDRANEVVRRYPDRGVRLPAYEADRGEPVVLDRPVPPAPSSLVGLIRSDLRAKAEWMYESRGWKAVVKTLLTDGTPAMIWYRLMQWARRWRLTPLELVFNRLNTICCGCIIGRGAEFGPGFVLIHSIGVVINGSVRGGTRVHIEHQVTIGAEKRQSPVIGDGVFIGAGAKVIGPVTIGAGAKVGANAVVVHDVPPGVTVVGIPARPVNRKPAPPPAGEQPG